MPGGEWLLPAPAPAFRHAAAPTRIISRPAPECIQAGGQPLHWRDCAEHLFCMCAAAQTADRGQEGGGAGHAGRGRNAARWPRSLQALLLCWLPAALLHWRRTQRGLASLLSSGMPGDNDTALHGTRVQPVRVITLACARDYGPKRCAAGAFSLAVALMSFELTKKSTLCVGAGSELLA